MRRKDLLTGTIAGAAAAAIRRSRGCRDNSLSWQTANASGVKAHQSRLSNLSRRNAHRLAGPWEVFGEVMVASLGTTMNDQMPFDQYLVAKSTDQSSPKAGCRSFPHLRSHRRRSPTFWSLALNRALRADGVGSAGQPRSTRNGIGLHRSVSRCRSRALRRAPPTTHHAFYDDFAKAFPQVQVVRDVRLLRIH